MSDLVGNLEDRFCRVAAHRYSIYAMEKRGTDQSAVAQPICAFVFDICKNQVLNGYSHDAAQLLVVFILLS